ncbi:unnamed protein product [Arabis nemorensis]|uniref:Uncharacterized protein n=1 Tax=Arabis nemorensis TaxID=586526 RepID=A0A565BY90_9BRAS|nr:unnamed protein product [Arabis nemorensis]
MAKHQGFTCGVPRLHVTVLTQNPWEITRIEFERLDIESSREWLFLSDNIRPGAI